MGVAIGVVCHLEEGRFELFPESEVRGLVEALRSASLVIGFNSLGLAYITDLLSQVLLFVPVFLAFIVWRLPGGAG